MDSSPRDYREDLADLAARLARVEALLDEQSDRLTDLQESAAAVASPPPRHSAAGQYLQDNDVDDELDDDDGTEDEDGEPDGQEDQAPGGPVFIVLMSEQQAAEELQPLAVWVHEVLVPLYIGEPTPNRPWCPRWWKHPEAIARLHALWMAWEELTTPAVGGYTGPSTWHDDHLEPALAVLRSPEGPLAGCMTDPDKPRHRPAAHAPLAAPSSEG
ncbi:DUF4913 domain-containing protein [Streptosporangium canum]|uniref:DUF4913 domain-containing protein n=1 Tax=Streptosporangium canum TaxID=324952 RepID=UPI0036CD6AA0